MPGADRAGRPRYLPDLADLKTALTTLPAARREALILVGAQGLSYMETTAICAVAVGTIKGCVNRARTTLVQRLGMAGTDDIGMDAPTRAAINGMSSGAEASTTVQTADQAGRRAIRWLCMLVAAGFYAGVGYLAWTGLWRVVMPPP